MNTKTTIVLLLLLATTSTLLHAQTVDTIQPNPKAVLLKRIWMIRGSTTGEERVGEGAGAVCDVSGDTVNDIAIRSMAPYSHWEIYPSKSPSPPSILPFWKSNDTAGVPPVVVGDFYGDNDPIVVLGTETDRWFFGNLYRTSHLHLYHVIDTPGVLQKRVSLPNDTLFNEPFYPTTVIATDLDNDDDDELIIALAAQVHQGVRSGIAELWIYEGGPNFQVDSPTVVLKDTEENRIRFSLAIARLNHDPFPDLLITADYQANRDHKLKFFFGKSNLSAFSTTPERSITLQDPDFPRIGNGLLLTDSDADSVDDLCLPGPDGNIYLWRLGLPGKSAQSRSFRLDDADLAWRSQGFLTPEPVGPINDSTKTYSALALLGPAPAGQGVQMIVLSGGSHGPNNTYEAYYNPASDGMIPFSVFGNGGPAGDVNGDGWSDYLAANPSWFGNDAGIAMILAGGPYIPRDDNTTSVRDIPAEGRSQALSVWPNPVGDELNIAWRGDLPRMPQRFTIHDPLGRLVASGTVQPSIGAARWECGHVAAGQYLLTAYDRHGEVIATTTIIKQE